MGYVKHSRVVVFSIVHKTHRVGKFSVLLFLCSKLRRAEQGFKHSTQTWDPMKKISYIFLQLCSADFEHSDWLAKFKHFIGLDPDLVVYQTIERFSRR